MRQKEFTFRIRELVGCYAKVLYTMAPGQAPFRATDAITEVREGFRERMIPSSYKSVLVIPGESVRDIENYLKEFFKDKPGFFLQNYTRNKLRTKFTDEQLDTFPLQEILDTMQTVDNDGIRLIDRYTNDEESQEAYDNDFIDIYALVGNYACMLFGTVEEEDCFLCDSENKDGDKDPCKTCCINPEYKNNFHHTCGPSKDRYVCQLNCHYGYKICCKSCDRVDECGRICSDNPENCNQWLYNKEGNKNQNL